MAEERRKLIVGIDPGTTVGYAILDTTGKLIESSSSKELSLDALTSKISSIGAVLIVGCDKAKVPDFVASFATKTGAKVICPDEDLLVEEKRKLAQQMSRQNSHEMDAIASAIFAWKNIEPLFKRIDTTLVRAQKTHLAQEVKSIVIKKNLGIKNAIKLLDHHNLIRLPKEKKTTQEEKISGVKPITSLAQKEQITRLKQQKHLLATELAKTKKIASKLEKKVTELQDKNYNEPKLLLKEQRIQTLSNTVEQKELKIQELRGQNAKLCGLLSKSKDSIIMARLKNLGWQEYTHRKQKFPINPNDIIFVDDPYSFSQQTIDEIRAKNVTILSQRETKNNTLSTLGMAVMNVKDTAVEIHPSFAVIKKTELERKRKEKFWVQDIVQEYQQERKTTLQNQ